MIVTGSLHQRDNPARLVIPGRRPRRRAILPPARFAVLLILRKKPRTDRLLSMEFQLSQCVAALFGGLSSAR
jgi:hypothetical protein